MAARRIGIGVSAALLAALTILAQAVPVPREYYVDSRRGNDRGLGTKEQPWRSLSSLTNIELHPGDTILFARGSSFSGGFVINQSGTAAAPITITAYGEGPEARFTNPKSSSLHGNAIRVNASHVVVENLFFERCPINPVSTDVRKLGAVLLTTNAGYCVVRNCEMTETPIGVNVLGEHNLVTRNYIHDNNAPIKPRWGPIGIMVCTSHNEISCNRVINYCAPSQEYGHDGGAIEIHDRALPKVDISIHHNLSLRNQGFIEWVGHTTQDDFLIHHNVSMDYQSFLGFTGPCSNIRVENNTVVRVLAHKQPDSEDVVFWSYFGKTNIVFRNNIFVYDPSRVEPVFARGELDHSYNLYYRTDHKRIPRQANRDAYERKYLGGGVQLGIGDKIGDPLFRSLKKGDFHLLPGSPAIAAGTNLQYSADFDDRPIPSDRPPAIGAFEFSDPK